MKAQSLACAAILLFAPFAGGSEKLVIDEFDYADDAAAQAAWAPNDTGEPVAMMSDPDGGDARVLRLPCDYTRQTERNYWDRQVDLDLSRFGRFELRMYMDDPRCLSHFTLFFQSPGGWYGATIPLRKRGWQTVTMSRAAFRSEGAPAGWNEIIGIRLSPWKGGNVSSFFAVDYLYAFSEDIVIVRPTQYIRSRGSEARSAAQYADQMAALLAGAGILTSIIDDLDVPAGALAGRKLAICPYNPDMAEEVVQALVDFVAGGGKIMVFYSIAEPLADVLGITRGEYMPDTDGLFASLQFDRTVADGLPERAAQNSWNINSVRPATPATKVVATWYKSDGTTDGLPALTLNDAGVYMTHVLLLDDVEAKKQMMLALVGHLVPEVWPRVAEQGLRHIGRVARFESIDALAEYVGRNAVGRRKQRALQHILKARNLAEAARRTYDNERYFAVPAIVQEANREVERAYALSHMSRPGEFRGVWCHSA
ncbi:MAG: hypothetical protein ACE5O2_16180, partial [Armatimonadota bacterium]